LAIMSERERRFDVAEIHTALGELAAAMDDRPGAREHARQALLCYDALGLYAKAEQAQAWITRLESAPRP
jgi:hypothetical protein